jgi:hypothetical protein
MDPDETLGLLREKCAEALAESGAKRTDLVDEIAELFDGLDNWLTKGNFPPAAWRGAETEDHRA